MVSHILMTWCKTAVTPLLTHWSYCSLALSHRYHSIICFMSWIMALWGLRIQGISGPVLGSWYWPANIFVTIRCYSGGKLRTTEKMLTHRCNPPEFLYVTFPYSFHVVNRGGWGCEVSCGGHHRPRGKTTTGLALDGAVFDIAQILAYPVHNMSRSQLYLGFGHFGWLPSFFSQ